MKKTPRKLAQSAFEIITEDHDRACEDIPDSACREAPGNFFLNAANGSLTKLAEQLASPGLVLPWLFSALGAPASLTGFLVPISRGGSLLPQLAISSRIRAFKLRKWFWVGAGSVQFLALCLIALSALFLSGLTAGIAVLLLLAVFSVASGVGSVSFKDVLAKTIPKGKRGTLLSLRAVLGGLLALGAGLYLNTRVGEGEDTTLYVVLILAAAALWLLASVFFAFISEHPGETAGGRSALKEARAGFYLLREQPRFTRFILARSLLLSAILVIPFYSIFAREITGTEVGSLGLFVIANSLAMVLSSYFWGRFSDRSSRLVMAAGGMFTLAGGITALAFLFLPDTWQNPYAFSLVFFIGGMAHTGVRLGRKTYLVDAAPKKDRPLYVSVSNTLVGFVTLSSVFLGFLADVLGVAWLIGVFMLLALAGVFTALSLPEAENMVLETPDGNNSRGENL